MDPFSGHQNCRCKFIHDATVFWAGTLKVVARFGLRSEVRVSCDGHVGRFVCRSRCLRSHWSTDNVPNKCRHESLHPRAFYCFQVQAPISPVNGVLLIVFVNICKTTVLEVGSLLLPGS